MIRPCQYAVRVAQPYFLLIWWRSCGGLVVGDGEAQLVQDQADQGLVDPVCAGMQPQRAAELEPDGDEKGRKPLAPDNPRSSRVTAGSQNTTCEAARGHRPRGSAGNRRIAITSAWWFGTDIHDPPACTHSRYTLTLGSF